MSHPFAQRPPLQELSGVDAKHCRDPFSQHSAYEATTLDLPYHSLKGPGFERLCFELLRKEKNSFPRFFGVSGQSQYGIDLLTEEDGQTVVYQCKNLDHAPNKGEITSLLNLFEKEWLARTDLPKPYRFVLCCPQGKVYTTWEAQCKKFTQRTGVKLGTWFKDELDSRLRHAPDIVADAFSDKIATSFCANGDDWLPDLFWPVKDPEAGAALPYNLQRYAERHAQGRLYYDEIYQKEFDAILDRRQAVMLIRGLPGSGKTTMA
ncbi:MAG: hypothetical protein K2P84_00345, partial [Undibacterium sp.]|nr:hypothetical protein [Undibacterium sp.]